MGPSAPLTGSTGSDDLSALETVVLCGGRGTRSYPDTAVLPKPLLPVGGRPILDHVLGIYAAQGCRRFLLAAGYKQELLRERYAAGAGGLLIQVLDTGEDTDTGSRLYAAAQHLHGQRFFATYADGLADVDLGRLLAVHEASGTAATLTTVPLRSQYGTVVTDADDRVLEFREKPLLVDHWINGGFFLFDREALGHWAGPSLENDVLPGLAARGLLAAYRHPGFWMSMDTYKDRQVLDGLAASGRPPWATHESRGIGWGHERSP